MVFTSRFRIAVTLFRIPLCARQLLPQVNGTPGEMQGEPYRYVPPLRCRMQGSCPRGQWKCFSGESSVGWLQPPYVGGGAAAVMKTVKYLFSLGKRSKNILCLFNLLSVSQKSWARCLKPLLILQQKWTCHTDMQAAASRWVFCSFHNA